MAVIITRPNRESSYAGEKNILKKVRTREYLACFMPNGEWKERDSVCPYRKALYNVRVIHVWSTFKNKFEGEKNRDLINVRVIGSEANVQTYLKVLVGLTIKETWKDELGQTNVLLNATF